MSRATFLARVREAARLGRAYRVPTAELPPNTGYVGVSADLCDGLAAEIEAVGGVPQLVANVSAARDWLDALLGGYQARRVLAWRHELLDRLGLKELLALRGVTCEDYEELSSLTPDRRRARILAADVGVSSVDLAIAETGTLVVCAKPGQERMASLLAPVHIAVVSRSQIVPDLFDAFDRLIALGRENLPSNVAFITGPSKTGDIELQLTTGVHGPGKWHVLIVRET